jgi:beta-phosphoglucomutase family hydrolase
VGFVLGLSADIRACLFDLDGVITRTATVHAAAWKQTFDDFLRSRDGDGFAPFTPSDYDKHVDGKPREAGTRDFLASRGIDLPADEIEALSDRKNELVMEKIRAGQVEVFDTSVEYLRAVRAAGLKTAVVSSSANCKDVIESVGIAELFDARVDGVVAREEHIAGKPAPDMFLAAAARLGVAPALAAVFEDALAGVESGRAGGFENVIGVNRADGADRLAHAAALREHGASQVVDDLGELLR